MKRCTSCGAVIPEGWNSCDYCEKPYKKSDETIKTEIEKEIFDEVEKILSQSYNRFVCEGGGLVDFYADVFERLYELKQKRRKNK